MYPVIWFRGLSQESQSLNKSHLLPDLAVESPFLGPSQIHGYSTNVYVVRCGNIAFPLLHHSSFLLPLSVI